MKTLLILALGFVISFALGRSVGRHIDDFIHPKCPHCGSELKDHGGSAGGISPEPIYICESKSCQAKVETHGN